MSKYVQLIKVMNTLEELPLKLTIEGETLLLIKSEERMELILVQDKDTLRNRFVMNNNDEMDAYILEQAMQTLGVSLHNVDIEQNISDLLSRELRFANTIEPNENLRQMSIKYQDRYARILSVVFDRTLMFA